MTPRPQIKSERRQVKTREISACHPPQIGSHTRSEQLNFITEEAKSGLRTLRKTGPHKLRTSPSLLRLFRYIMAGNMVTTSGGKQWLRPSVLHSYLRFCHFLESCYWWTLPPARRRCFGCNVPGLL